MGEYLKSSDKRLDQEHLLDDDEEVKTYPIFLHFP